MSLWSSQGALLGRTSASVQPEDVLTSDLQTLLGSSLLAQARAVTVDYFGVFRTLAAQAVLLNFAHGGSVDAQLLEDEEFWSNELNAVWWTPVGAAARIAIFNTSSNEQTVSWSSKGEESTSVSVPALGVVWETPSPAETQAGIGSFHISTDGANGTIRALGFVATPDGSYVNTLRFLDPGASLSDSLYATGLSFPGPSYSLVLHNVSPSPIQVAGKAFFRSKNGSTPPPVDLRPLTLPGLGSAQVRLEDSLQAGLEDVTAVKLTSFSGRATLIAGLSILYPGSPGLSASVPFRDVTTEESATGGYPWRIDGDYTTTVYLTNATSEDKTIVARVAAAGQTDYVLNPKQLQAGETALFNLRAMHDSSTPDQNGKAFPNLSAGQFIWSIAATQNDEGGILGRAVMESRRENTLRSYSCFSCTCGAAISYLSSQGPSGNLTVNQEAAVYVFGNYTSRCGATQIPPRAPVTPSSWENYNPQFNIVDGNPSEVTAIESGIASLTAHYTANPITFNQGSCTYTQQDVTTTVNVTAGTLASQIPTYLPVVATTLSQPSSGCPAGTSGWDRAVTRQVQDQRSASISAPGQLMQEQLTLASDGMKAANGDFRIGYQNTNALGQISDEYAACGYACPSNPSAMTYVNQAINDTWNGGSYSMRTSSLAYGCKSVTVDGK